MKKSFSNDFIQNDLVEEKEEDILISLTKEQERLNEELEELKKQGESLKRLYSQDLNITSSNQRSILNTIRLQLLKIKDKDENIKEAISLLKEFESQESAFIPDTPRVTELATEAKETEIITNKFKKENKNLKKILENLNNENNTLIEQISFEEKQLQELIESKNILKEKLKNYVENCKKRENLMKEKINSLEEQIDFIKKN